MESRTFVLQMKEEMKLRTRPEYDFKVIGKNLRKLRIRQHLTVEDVREYMQLGTVQAVYKWERGESLPQADSLLALMELYQVHSVDMLVGESKMLSPVVFYRYHRSVGIVWITANTLLTKAALQKLHYHFREEKYWIIFLSK